MDKPYLTLVDSHKASEHDEEFEQLPFYNWRERPLTVPLTVEECATAIHLAEGNLVRAAGLLRTALYKLNREIARSPRLQRIWQEANTLTAHRAAGEYIDALGSESDRRREWGARSILATRAASNHPFAPAPPQPNSASIALTQTPSSRTITFRFRNDDDPDPSDVV